MEILCINKPSQISVASILMCSRRCRLKTNGIIEAVYDLTSCSHTSSLPSDLPRYFSHALFPLLPFNVLRTFLLLIVSTLGHLHTTDPELSSYQLAPGKPRSRGEALSTYDVDGWSSF